MQYPEKSREMPRKRTIGQAHGTASKGKEMEKVEEQKKVRWLAERCPVCDERVNSWDKRLSKATGYKQILCECCIAKEYDITVEELRETAEHHFGLIPCFGI